MAKQPVFLRSMSAPSDLEMIASQDLEFTHAPQRYADLTQGKHWDGCTNYMKTMHFIHGSLSPPATRRRHHPTSHRSSSFTLLQSLAIEDSRDKPTYSVLLGQLFAFIGTTPDQAVSPSSSPPPPSAP